MHGFRVSSAIKYDCFIETLWELKDMAALYLI